MVADHLSRLNYDTKEESVPIKETFPDEQLFAITEAPWYANLANYLATCIIPFHYTLTDK